MAQTNVQAFSGDVAISSNLAVDTNTLFVDSVGNKVGIGKANPGSALDVVGTVTASGVIAGATGVNGTPLVLNVGRGDVTFEYNTYDRGNDDGAGITIRTSANPVLDSMFAVRSSGHASRLWVGQDLTSVGSNQLCAGFSGADGTEGVLDSYKFIVKTNGDVAISSNLAVDTNTLFVDSVGNKVGIGTANPETKLHVKGGSICVHRTFPDTPDAGIVFMEDHANKDCMFIAYDGGGVAETDDESLRFYSKSAGGADPTITGANLLMCMRADGNVGIGTASPGARLDVYGSIKSRLPWLWAQSPTYYTTDTASHLMSFTTILDRDTSAGNMGAGAYKSVAFPLTGTYVVYVAGHSVFGGSHLSTFPGTLYNSSNGERELFYSQSSQSATGGNYDNYAGVTYVVHANSGDYMNIYHNTTVANKRNYGGNKQIILATMISGTY